MHQEHVVLTNVEIEQLYAEIKKYLQDLKLDIIHEDRFPSYWSLKAYKGGTLNTITGSVRDVEVMISGSENSYDLVLRTGAWGRDIFVPGAIAGVITGGIGAAAVAAAEIYRAHTFEKNFWNWINKVVSELGKENASISEPKVIVPSQKENSTN
jgi:hypothetical protein